MRILIPTIDFPPIEGGIATLAREVARELARAGHNVTVVAPRSGEAGQRVANLDALDAAEPMRIVRFGGYGLGRARWAPCFVAAWPLTRETDLILGINIAYGGVIGRMARLRHGTPYVTFAYAYEFLKFMNRPLARRVLRNVYDRAAANVAISTFTRESLVRFGVSRENITTILPGAPEVARADAGEVARVCARLGIEAPRFVLGVGRFIQRKGQETLVAAWPYVTERCPNVALVLVGRGPQRETCMARARSMGIEGLIHFPGYVEEAELAALYEGCAAFALPTGTGAAGHVEGFGLVFSEAHAHGKAVLAGRSGGVPDAVLDGETGLLVPADDTLALGEALVRLLSEPRLSSRLGEAGRARVEAELNWRVFVQRMLEAAEAGQ